MSPRLKLETEICVIGLDSHNTYNQNEFFQFVFQPFSTALPLRDFSFMTEISTRMNSAFMNKEDILYCYYLATFIKSLILLKHEKQRPVISALQRRYMKH